MVPSSVMENMWKELDRRVEDASFQERLKYMYADEAALEIIGSDPIQIVITIPIP